MTERYRMLDHPADGKFRAFGTTMEEAFANAALATASIMVDWEKVERRVEYPVRIEAGDPGTTPSFRRRAISRRIP